MPFQYANEANPRAHYEGTGAEIAEALDRVDVLVAGLGTGGTLMGAGERLRESFPDVVVAAAEPLPGDPVMGLRSLDDGYVPPILDVAKLDRKLLVSNEEAVAGVHALLEQRGHLRRSLERRRPPRRPPPRGRARGGSRRLRPRRRRLEVPLRRLLAGRGDRREQAVVVVPPPVREALAEHARRGAAERELRPARPARPRRRPLRAGPQRRRVAVPLRARGRSRALVPRGRGLRARGRPLARLGAAAPVAHRRRERRPLAGPAVPHLLGRARRARRLDDRERRDRAARARVGPRLRSWPPAFTGPTGRRPSSLR